MNPLKVNITLWVFMNSYRKNEQQRGSFPMSDVLIEAYPKFYQRLIEVIRERLYSKKAEVRLGLLFEPFTRAEEQKMHDLI